MTHKFFKDSEGGTEMRRNYFTIQRPMMTDKGRSVEHIVQRMQHCQCGVELNSAPSLLLVCSICLNQRTCEAINYMMTQRPNP